MEVLLICVFNKENILEDVYCPKSSLKHELSVHVHASVGMHRDVIFFIPDKIQEGFFEWGQNLYWYASEEREDQTVLFVSDGEVRRAYLEKALDTVPLGVQIFDTRGFLLYLNKTCEKMENLKLKNVKGKHVMEIYDVDQEYSTIMNTLKTRKMVENRCGIFQNKEGDRLYSLNTGTPLFLENKFLGAVGDVYNMDTLDEILEKKEIIHQYLKECHKTLRIHDHEEKRYNTFEDMIGESQVMKETIKLAKKVAVNDSSIMLYGETGVGKEIFAQSIHSASMRKQKEFVAVNCAALPSGIIESLLFGTVKGAFTGSMDKKGILETADGGTLFLDEINSMEISLQSKLLRVIQEKRFRRVGDTKEIPCDVRILSAMNEEPEQAVSNHHLREDLYYRLAAVAIWIPPLRERREDIIPLARWRLSQISRKYFREISSMSSQVEKLLEAYDWPGNVRELFQVLEYACNFAEGKEMQRNNLPERLLHASCMEKKKAEKSSWNVKSKEKLEEISEEGSLQERLLLTEKKILEKELKKNQYNISKTAEALGIKRQNLQYRMKKCGIRLNISLEI